MFNISKTVQIAFAALLRVAPAAYAQQQSGMSDSKMPGMGGMQSKGMGNMDMQTMMKHCAQMHRGMTQGKPIAPGMQKMMKQCDQMNTGPKVDTQAPAATEDR